MKRMCSRCLHDETVPGISFDENGVCNYCHTHDRLNLEYPTGEEGMQRLKALAERIRNEICLPRPDTGQPACARMMVRSP